jgi:hypothetical protein
MQPANLGLIVQYTESGFVGKAVSTTQVQTSQGWADEIVFEVTDPIIGKLHKNEKVTWRQVKSGNSLPLAGMPSYQPGAEYVIFLTAKAPGSELQAPMALGQGTFSVSRDEKGAAFARNDFQNASLLQDMDVDALSEAIVDDNSGGLPLQASDRAKKVVEVKSRLQNRQAEGTDLGTLKDAAKTLKKSGAAQTKFARKGGTPAAVLSAKVK